MGRIIAYNIRDEKADRVRCLCRKHSIPLLEASDAMHGRCIADILGGAIGNDGVGQKLFDDEMLLFDGIDDDLLHVLLREVRQAGGVELKAVVTPFNRLWTSLQLRNELLREQAEMSRAMANK